MRRLVFELSGEHDTLPKAEAIACIEAYGWHYEVTGDFDGVLVVDTDADPIVLAERLALTHHILELVLTSEPEKESILAAVESADVGLREGRSFLVRVNRVREYSDIGPSFERKLGAVIWKKGYPVSLQNPDVTFRVIITDGVCVLGRLIKSVNRTQFDERSPLKKPFFFPGVLMPRFARAVVNLSRIKEGWALDPFTGTGGILVEAGLVSGDIRPVGCDIQKKMAYGTRKNLRHYCGSADVIMQDSTRMPLKPDSFDCAFTDFPYGQSTPIASASKETLYFGALGEIRRVLKPGRYAVIVSKEPMEKVIRETGFIVIETHTQRIHRSLTRHFTVIKKGE